MRSKKAVKNVLFSVFLQLTSIICGFIIPYLIINNFGSNTNGMITSITRFLGYIALLEAGAAGVIRAALYIPLAKKDNLAISKIIKSTERFFRYIAVLFIMYLAILALIFPYIVESEYSNFYVSSIVIIIGLSTLFQYFFGITYQVFLKANQQLYLVSLLQIIAIIFNTLLVVILIRVNADLHFILLGSAIIFLLRPMFLNWYVKRKFNFIKNCGRNDAALSQKWDGLGHHTAYFVNNNTDVVLITIFSSLKEVSVYSIYFMFVMGVRNLITIFSSGVEAAFGDMLAKEEKTTLIKNFNMFEFLIFFLTTFLFTSLAFVIIPFITLYTQGIDDANYIRPIFSNILIASAAVYCIRLPYHSIVVVAGHFKQTRNGAYLEAGLNIIVSLLLVSNYGLIGVAIGSLFAMTFRTLQYVIYLSKNILKRSFKIFVKRILVNLLSITIVIELVNNFSIPDVSAYIDLTEYVIIVVSITLIVTFLINLIFYHKEIKNLIKVLTRVIKK